VALALAGVAVAQTSGWARYRVYVNTPEEAQRLADSSLTLYSENITIPSTEMAVGPDQLPELWALNLPYQRVAGIEPIDRYKDYVRTQAFDFTTQYGRLADIIGQFEDFRTRFPRYVTRQQIGTSIENRPIWAYRIWNPDSFTINEPPPRSIVVLNLIHAREWISGSVGMYIADQLLRNMQLSPVFLRRMNRVQVWIVPCHNPDGYEFTWTNNRLWRKNRRRNSGGTFGVDLNRNYATGWGQNGGSSNNPSSDVYHGTGPFSEPETQAIRDFANSLHPNNPIIGQLDYHSFGQYILWPWGYTTSRHPSDPTLRLIASNMRTAMVNGGGRSYTIGQASTTLYIASGITTDWFIQTFNAPGLTVELRDTGAFGFELPPSEILPTCRETWNGFNSYLTQLVP
jgi:murein tripeptide amidase MpaA